VEEKNKSIFKLWEENPTVIKTEKELKRTELSRYAILTQN